MDYSTSYTKLKQQSKKELAKRFKNKSKAQRKRVLILEEKPLSKGANHAGRKPGGICRICFISFDERSSYKERKGNALASGADEGRDKLR